VTQRERCRQRIVNQSANAFAKSAHQFRNPLSAKKNQHDDQHGRTLRKQLSAIPNPEPGKESQLRFETAEERFSQQASFGMTDWLLFAVG